MRFLISFSPLFAVILSEWFMNNLLQFARNFTSKIDFLLLTSPNVIRARKALLHANDFLITSVFGLFFVINRVIESFPSFLCSKNVPGVIHSQKNKKFANKIPRLFDARARSLDWNWWCFWTFTHLITQLKTFQSLTKSLRLWRVFLFHYFRRTHRPWK